MHKLSYKHVESTHKGIWHFCSKHCKQLVKTWSAEVYFCPDCEKQYSQQSHVKKHQQKTYILVMNMNIQRHMKQTWRGIKSKATVHKREGRSTSKLFWSFRWKSRKNMNLIWSHWFWIKFWKYLVRYIPEQVGFL